MLAKKSNGVLLQELLLYVIAVVAVVGVPARALLVVAKIAVIVAVCLELCDLRVVFVGEPNL